MSAAVPEPHVLREYALPADEYRGTLIDRHHARWGARKPAVLARMTSAKRRWTQSRVTCVAGLRAIGAHTTAHTTAGDAALLERRSPQAFLHALLLDTSCWLAQPSGTDTAVGPSVHPAHVLEEIS